MVLKQIIVFSLEGLNDKSNFLEPGIYSDGLTYVLVNGEIIINNFKGTKKFLKVKQRILFS